jgi:DNA-binding FadR family transcriptional regulator
MERVERRSLGAEVEASIERALAEGRLAVGSGLPSERLLARQAGVGRGTAREALRQPGARGVPGPRRGRSARVCVSGALAPLELLGTLVGRDGALRPGRGPLLLEGFLALKRETTVSLLAHACECASRSALNDVLDAVFVLRSLARWEEPAHAISEAEFALLRSAAVAAERPGHVHLVHTLQRGFAGVSCLLLPDLPHAGVRAWTERVWSLLGDRASTRLGEELPPLLASVDAHLLARAVATVRICAEHAASPGAP